LFCYQLATLFANQFSLGNNACPKVPPCRGSVKRLKHGNFRHVFHPFPLDTLIHKGYNISERGVKMKTNEVVRVSYYTDAETRRRLKLLAAKTDRSITEIVDEVVKTYLDKHED
jgi:hypothetical protein